MEKSLAEGGKDLEHFDPIDARTVFKKANLETIKKIVSLGFIFRNMGTALKAECCFKAIKQRDVAGFLYLMERLKISYNARTTAGPLINSLLFDNLEMAKKVFESTPFPIPSASRGEKPPVIDALEKGREDVAAFIASSLRLNDPGPVRTYFLKALLSYVRDNNVRMIRAVAACGVRFEPMIEMSFDRRGSFDILDKFFTQIPDLLAHALMEGEEELIPILLPTQEKTLNINYTLLACQNLALKTKNAHDMRRLEEATKRLLELGGDINFDLSAPDAPESYSLMSGLMINFLVHPDLYATDGPILDRLEEQILFLVKNGANPIFKLGANETSIDFLKRGGQKFRNIKLLHDIIKAIEGPNALKILSEMFLTITRPQASEPGPKAIPETFLPLFFKLCSLLFREFPEISVELRQQLYTQLVLNVSRIVEPIFEGQSLLIYALENANKAIKRKKSPQDLENVLSLLLHPDNFDLLSSTCNRNPDTLIWINAFHYNTLNTRLQGLFPMHKHLLSNYKHMPAYTDLLLRTLVRIDEPSNQVFMLLEQNTKLSKRVLACLRDDEKWEGIASKEKRQEIYHLIKYGTPTRYDISKLVKDLDLTEKKEIHSIDIKAQLNVIINGIDFKKRFGKGKGDLVKKIFNIFLKKKVVERLERRLGESGTPDAESSPGVRNPQLDKFYDEITFKVKHYIWKTLKEIATMSTEEKESHYYLMISELRKIFSNCGARWEGELRALCTQSNTTCPDFASALHIDLGKIRMGILEYNLSKCQLEPGNYAHYFNKITQKCSAEFGLPVAQKSFEGNTYVGKTQLTNLIHTLRTRLQCDYNAVFIIKRLTEVLSGNNVEQIFDPDTARRAIVNTLLRVTKWQEEGYKRKAAEVLKEAHRAFISTEERGKEAASSPEAGPSPRSEPKPFEALWRSFRATAESPWSEEETYHLIYVSDSEKRFKKIYDDHNLSKERLKKEIEGLKEQLNALPDESQERVKKEIADLEKQMEQETKNARKQLNDLVENIIDESRAMNYYAEVFDGDTGLIKPEMARKFLLSEKLLVFSDRVRTTLP